MQAWYELGLHQSRIYLFLLNLAGPSILFNYASLKCWARAVCLECKYGLKKSIAQAKNGDKLFWEKNFHAANRKAQACTQECLAVFPFKLGGQGFIGLFPDVFADAFLKL